VLTVQVPAHAVAVAVEVIETHSPRRKERALSVCEFMVERLREIIPRSSGLLHAQRLHAVPAYS
jgi:hypothetical protein